MLKFCIGYIIFAIIVQAIILKEIKNAPRRDDW